MVGKTNLYSVKQVSELSGVSVRTLHLYDEIGLLKPGVRTESRYRLYGEKELLRLQQILFYKELDFTLEQIGNILDDPDFDIFRAMHHHRDALLKRRERMDSLIATIDKTIVQLNEKTMLQPEELYAGLPKEVGTSYRKQAIEEYGTEPVMQTEKFLGKLGKEGFEKLKTEAREISEQLFLMQSEDFSSAAVQNLIARHYASTRMFWGTTQLSDKQAEAYKGLGQLYLADERFTMFNGQPQPAFALFMSKAMAYFADTTLRD
ncbi:MAG TPA: MerR family transcriptional regulator [Microcoleus sp.]|nr:MerR family transcriptional regulator [Microcoleus sp.]